MGDPGREGEGDMGDGNGNGVGEPGNVAPNATQQFFGGRKFIFPSWLPIRSRRKTKLSCFHRSRRLGLFQGPRGGESTGNGK